MRITVALALLALGCNDPVSSAPVVTHADAGVDTPDVPDVFVPEGCDARVQGTLPGILCRGDAATADSPGVPIAEGLCVSPGSLFNCGACGNVCEDGRGCCDDPQGSSRGWHCCFRPTM